MAPERHAERSGVPCCVRVPSDRPYRLLLTLVCSCTRLRHVRGLWWLRRCVSMMAPERQAERSGVPCCVRVPRDSHIVYFGLLLHQATACTGAMVATEVCEHDGA